MSDDPLVSARRAIEIERAHANRPTPVRVVRAWRVAPQVLGVTVDTDEPITPSAWTGGVLGRRLVDGVDLPLFQLPIIEVDADHDTVFVEVPADAAPPVDGPAVVLPFDFLRAPWDLLTEARFEPLRGRLRDALVGVTGADLPLEVEGPPGLRAAWRHDRVVVWGPPGTGKTWTVVEQVHQLLTDPTERVLIVSTTHRATDEVALRLGRRLRDGGRLAGALRLGRVLRPERYRDEGLGPMLPAVDDALADEIGRLREVAAVGSPAERAEARRALTALLRMVPTLSSRALHPDDRCLFTTLHGALRAITAEDVVATLLAGDPPFTTVVVDEAGLVGRAQAAAVSLLASRRVVWVGDPRQLAPIVQASRSMPPEVHRWLARSPIDHLTDDTDEPAVMTLWTQRRMHPEIREVVSALSYGGRLEDAPELAARRWGDPALRRLPAASWYVLDEHDARRVHAERGPHGRSRQRPLATEVIDALVALHPALRRADVLFVTPYRAQVQLVRAHVEAAGLAWRVSTVHAQQGSEADVVLFDTVFASSVTWSADGWRRLLNVGLSRARHLVLVLASRMEMDQPCLAPLRERLTARVIRRGAWVTVGDPDRAAPALFGRPAGREPAGVTAEPAVGWGRVDAPADASGDRLGAQLAARRALSAIPSAEQAALIERELADVGPRLVRGVAGSGKTLVLAHWVVHLLTRLGVREAVVVYANRSLHALLEAMIARAWEARQTAALPWDRVRLVHVGDLLAELLRERGLTGAGDGPYDYEGQASALLDAWSPEPRLPALFVDEAQDLGHDVLRLLIALVAPDPHGHRPVMLFYDNAQNVYGRRTPAWRELGLDLRGRSDVMKEAFRSTRPNVELALDLLDRLRPIEGDPDLRELMRTQPPLLWRDAEGWWQAAFCAVDGQAPQVRVFEDREAEVRVVVQQVAAWIRRDGVPPGDVRILTMQGLGERAADALRRELPGVRVLARRAEGFADAADAVVISTPHSFKGHDAELVVVMGLDAFVSRRSGVLASVIYVALTRARTLMLVTATRADDPGGAQVVRALEDAARRWR